jgi:hypothetical protein
VANVRLHHTTRERPVDRFQKERPLLRPLAAILFDTGEVVSAMVNLLAQFEFRGDRYSVPPAAARTSLWPRFCGMLGRSGDCRKSATGTEGKNRELAQRPRRH